MSDPLQTPLGDTWPQMPAGWTLDDTEAFLKRYALPTDFRWDRTVKRDGHKVIVPDQPVLPDYQLSKGYGFWLRTTPYFPGLFEEVHDILLRWPDDEAMPDPDQLAERLRTRKAARGKQAEIGL
jgi:hypothetical protein